MSTMRRAIATGGSVSGALLERRDVIDLDLPLSQMTPAQAVTWTVVGAGVYAEYHVRPQYISERWGVVPKSAWKNRPPRVLHICRPRKIFWEARDAYRRLTGHKGRPFEMGVETSPWGPGSKAEKLTVTMNGFAVLDHSTAAWVVEWDCTTLDAGDWACYMCKTDAPPAALGLQRFMQFGEKV